MLFFFFFPRVNFETIDEMPRVIFRTYVQFFVFLFNKKLLLVLLIYHDVVLLNVHNCDKIYSFGIYNLKTFLKINILNI